LRARLATAGKAVDLQGFGGRKWSADDAEEPIVEFGSPPGPRRSARRCACRRQL